MVTFINYVTWHVKQTGYSYPSTVSLDFFSALHSCTKLLVSSVRGTCTYVLSRRWYNSNLALTSNLQLRALRRNCLSKWELGCIYYRFTLFIVTFMNADHTRCRSLAIVHDIAVFLPLFNPFRIVSRCLLFKLDEFYWQTASSCGLSVLKTNRNIAGQWMFEWRRFIKIRGLIDN